MECLFAVKLSLFLCAALHNAIIGDERVLLRPFLSRILVSLKPSTLGPLITVAFLKNDSNVYVQRFILTQLMFLQFNSFRKYLSQSESCIYVLNIELL